MPLYLLDDRDAIESSDRVLHHSGALNRIIATITWYQRLWSRAPHFQSADRQRTPRSQIAGRFGVTAYCVAVLNQARTTEIRTWIPAELQARDLRWSCHRSR